MKYWITVVYINGNRTRHNNVSESFLKGILNDTAFDKDIAHVNYGEEW